MSSIKLVTLGGVRENGEKSLRCRSERFRFLSWMQVLKYPENEQLKGGCRYPQTWIIYLKTRPHCGVFS